MRKISIGSTRHTEVVVNDEAGAGGACHSYSVLSVPQTSESPIAAFAQIDFQNGPVKESGVNGIHQEDLLVVVLDRLKSFQAGEYSCRENALAITKIEEAMHWLNHRTRDRMDRGVEGTSNT
jgi:hypothetical protein